MKIFTEKAFENRLARERERMERDRYIMERLDKLSKDLSDLKWRVNALADKVTCSKTLTPVCEEVLTCDRR